MLGGKKINKLELDRQYGCCWRTIDKRLNPDKYKEREENYRIKGIKRLSKIMYNKNRK